MADSLFDPPRQNPFEALAQMRPTPRNALLGLFATALNGVNSYASTPDRTMPMGLANPPLAILNGLLGIPSLAKTVDRLSYGEPLTNAGKANVPFLKPETGDVLAMAPISPRTALAAAVMAHGGTGLLDHSAASAGTLLAPLFMKSVGGQGARAEAMTAQELKTELLSKYAQMKADEPYAHYGVRVFGQDQPVQVGQTLARSSKWVDGRPLTTKLPGTAVFQLRGRDAEAAIDRALAYNLGSSGQRIGLVRGDELGANFMPEPFSALIKSPVVTHLYDRPDELGQITRTDELRGLLR